MLVDFDIHGLLQELFEELLAGSPMLAKLERRINTCKYGLFLLILSSTLPDDY